MISTCLMAHPKRKPQALELQSKLNCEIVWDNKNSEWDTGARALQHNLESEWTCVLQDDCITSDNFYTNLNNAIKNVPTKSLISLYTGQVRPKAMQVVAALEIANTEGASWLSYHNLLWGVGIVMPTEDVKPLLDYVKFSRLPYDFRIGLYYSHVKRPVYYTKPSLVDHNWELKSLIGHDKKDVKRVAHQFSDDIITWNSQVVPIEDNKFKRKVK